MKPPLFSNPFHTALPRHVQEALREAAKVDPASPPGLSKLRAIALEDVIARAKRNCPQLFVQEDIK